MKWKAELRAAAAVVASTAGVGFASMRGAVLFFAQTGAVSWLGVVTASVLFGVFCGCVAVIARKTDSDSVFSLYDRAVGGGLGRLLCVLHGALWAFTVAFMLGTAGRMAELALPFYNAYGMGVAASFGAALLLNLHGGRGMQRTGMMFVLLQTFFMLVLWMDPTEVSLRPNYEVSLELENSVSASLTLAAVFAALNAAAASEITVRNAPRIRHRGRFAFLCGIGMLTTLAVANGAVRSGGEKLCAQVLPTVVLAARWGKTGYYLSIASALGGAVFTLAASLCPALSGVEKICRKHVLNYEKRSK